MTNFTCMFNGIFYTFYQFYKWTRLESQPIAMSVFALSVLQGFIVNTLIQLLLLSSCGDMEKWEMFAVFLGVVALNAIYFHFQGNAKRIIASDQSKNKKRRIVLTLLFFGLSFFVLIAGATYSKNYMDLHCR